MTVETAIAAAVALTTLATALAALLVQMAALRKDLNGRLQQLLEHAVEAARHQGELEGRDFMRRLLTGEPPHDLGPDVSSRRLERQRGLDE